MFKDGPISTVGRSAVGLLLPPHRWKTKLLLVLISRGSGTLGLCCRRRLKRRVMNATLRYPTNAIAIRTKYHNEDDALFIL